MDYEEKKIDGALLYDGKILKLRRDEVSLPDGCRAFREVVEHNGGCAVAALTDDGEILVVKQFRYPYGEVICEIPAGKLEKGELPEICAARELAEETGATAARWKKWGELYPTPGYTTEKIHLFFAKELTFDRARPDDGEFISFEKMPLERAVKLISEGVIKDGKTVAAVSMLAAGMIKF